MSARVNRIVVAGRDAPLWLAASVLRKALGAEVVAVELPTALGPADVHPTLPPLEALHDQLRIDEPTLLRNTRGAFTLGQNFVDASGAVPSFIHPYGAIGTAIEGRDFFAYWLKARRFGLDIGLDHFSLAASAARNGRLMIPDDDTEVYGRSDYGYHLPALPYARTLRAIAKHYGVEIRAAQTLAPEMDGESGAIRALLLDGDRRVEGDFFVDATGMDALLMTALGVGRESWRAHFPADRMLVANGPRFTSIPAYSEHRAWAQGWVGLYPGQTGTHVVQIWSSDLCSEADAARGVTAATGITPADARVRPLDPGRREAAWAANCVAIGAAACAMDPVHSPDLHTVHLGLIHLLAHFPVSPGFAAERAEYNRLMRGSFERVRDYQSAHYALARYAGPFWEAARAAPVPDEAAHLIALFRARGEIALFEEESFAHDSWRALLIGHGVDPRTWLPRVDTTSPDEMKAQFRRMLGFVKEAVLRMPTHDEALARLGGARG